LEMTDDTRLMQLWHTGEAAASIAHRTGERADSILARWRQLQRAGLLPEQRVCLCSKTGCDGRPQAGDGGDPLLEKLIEVHGDGRK
jgi:hypothetical protein